MIDLHRIAAEMGLKGALLVLLAGALIWTLFVIGGSRVANTTPPLVAQPAPHVVPATGEQGYPVVTFCQDPATTVQLTIPPPDSTFTATYDLDRRLNGVHEHIAMSVYANGSAVATYYDSSNVPHDGDPTDALKCIRGKVGK